MRISSLVIQGLVAGTILFLPSVAFADKGIDSGEQERGRSGFAKQNENAANKPAPPGKSVSDQVKSAERKQVPAKRPAGHKGPKQKSVPESVKQAAPASQNAKKKEQPIKKQVQAQPKKIPANDSLHKQSVTAAKRVPLQPLEEAQATIVPQSNKKVEVKKAQVIFSVPAKKRVPVPVPIKSSSIPQDQAVLVQTLQTLQASSKDKEQGGKSSLFMKGMLMFSEKEDENEPLPSFFSRLDLLRNQWVNAPPSEPPRFALLFFS
ncbi:hypothetical protein ACFQPF_18215 [Fictibacillus iocasae]|uniref:Uncharacterized protein n=1 Tax=Fictibacillus iocasae TaxID=2715437 RepID=A0ABW2NW22_9BACL